METVLASRYVGRFEIAACASAGGQSAPREAHQA